MGTTHGYKEHTAYTHPVHSLHQRLLPTMPSNKPVILITGGAGYIGSHVTLCCLLTRKYRVAVIETFTNSFPEAVNRVSKIALDELPSDASEEDKADSQVKCFNGDLKKAEDVQAIFDHYKNEGAKVWGVIHIAALKAVGESGEKPIEYYQNNISALVGLLDIMRKNDCYRLVYSSSATVYGAPKTIPIPETSPLVAESVYGRTKGWASGSSRMCVMPTQSGAPSACATSTPPEPTPRASLARTRAASLETSSHSLHRWRSESSQRKDSRSLATTTRPPTEHVSATTSTSWISPRVTSSCFLPSRRARSTPTSKSPRSAVREASTRRTTSERVKECRFSTWSRRCARPLGSSTSTRL